MNFSKEIIGWFAENKRDLPWRNTRNPYFIWLSEVILQQTRVAQGTAYYQKFVAHYPTVQQLAQAPETEVLKLWQGLGYYSRARNLVFTAQYVTQELGGVFPRSYTELQKLKGVGSYTAAAIASFAYGLPHAVVDGNVYRVLSRYLGIYTPINAPEAKQEFEQWAQQLLDKSQPDLHNQAIMEFGALHCTPQKPLCHRCPLAPNCQAFIQNAVEILPQKLKKAPKKNRYFNYLVLKDTENNTFFTPRAAGDIWQGLYDFLLVESTEQLLNQAEIEDYLHQKLEMPQGSFALKVVSEKYKHILTHQNIFAVFWVFEVFFKIKATNLLEICNLQAIIKLPVSRLVEVFLIEHKNSINESNTH